MPYVTRGRWERPYLTVPPQKLQLTTLGAANANLKGSSVSLGLAWWLIHGDLPFSITTGRSPGKPRPWRAVKPPLRFCLDVKVGVRLQVLESSLRVSREHLTLAPLAFTEPRHFRGVSGF